jgi:hypothetical protein
MSSKWIMWSYIVTLLFSVLDAVYAWTTTVNVQSGILTAILNFTMIKSPTEIIPDAIGLVIGMFNTILFNYSFVNNPDGSWGLFHFALLFFSAGFLWGIVQLVTGKISATIP